MNRINIQIYINCLTLYVTIIIVCVKCQQGGFSDQIYTLPKPNINNYQHHRNSNNNNPQITTAGNIPYSIDDLEHKFVIDVKRNKDGKLEPLVRKTSPSSSSSSSPPSSSSSVTILPDTNGRIDKPTRSNGIIHFPTSDYSSTILEYPTNSLLLQQYQQQQQQQLKNKILIPQCNSNGIGNSFCTQVDNYPIDAVIKAIQQESTKFEAVFGEDLLPEPQTEISQRIDPDFGEETLCQSRERLIFPQAGMTKDSTWSFIINHENYTQGIRVEECTNPGSQCLMAENFPNGYRTECKQKFIYRQLLSMNEQGIIKKDLFQLPSCCKCYIKSY